MNARKLASEDIGIPTFRAEPGDGGVFSLGSHARAKDALDFGLSTYEPGFHIFVVGAERSGRLTQTMAYLREKMSEKDPPPDWLYLNNFRHPHRPRPCKVPAGMGRRFRDRVAQMIPDIREALQRAFEEESHQSELQEPTQRLQEGVNQRLAEARAEAEKHGLTIVQTQSGPAVKPTDELQAKMNEMSADEMSDIQSKAQEIGQQLSEINRWAAKQQREVAEQGRELSKKIADEAIQELIQDVAQEFEGQGRLQRWLEQARMDMLDSLQRFAPQQPQGAPPMEPPEQRYAVNLFVDNGENEHPEVVLEPNPTYVNLFGRAEYRQAGVRLETDYSLLRPGALHRANGGVLVLRADALAVQPFSWLFLKGALRDGEIQMEDLRQQAAAIPIAGTPRPKPIPLDVKVVLIGAPQWFQTFFHADPDFQTHFRIKAEIDNDMPANEENLAHYASLLQELAKKHGADGCEPEAISRLLGWASRLAYDRTKLSSRFEMLEDIIAEARVRTKSGPISGRCVHEAIAERRERNARVEDKMHEFIADGTVLIETDGRVVGQVNGLAVHDQGDHAFGVPARVTARGSAGRKGVVNIERDVAMGGPIQQKAAMILQGFLSGQFARRIPVSFTGSITFEQSYGGVEGDSASLAEAVAIISDLAGLPVRQDIAITGSMNQRGEAQVVGGVAHKVEGFFRACQDKPSGLSGNQGVIVPDMNTRGLVVEEEVADAIADGSFHVWSVKHVNEALELLLDATCGEPDESGHYPSDTIFGKVEAQLLEFHENLAAVWQSEA